MSVIFLSCGFWWILVASLSYPLLFDYTLPVSWMLWNRLRDSREFYLSVDTKVGPVTKGRESHFRQVELNNSWPKDQSRDFYPPNSKIQRVARKNKRGISSAPTSIAVISHNQMSNFWHLCYSMDCIEYFLAK